MHMPHGQYFSSTVSYFASTVTRGDLHQHKNWFHPLWFLFLKDNTEWLLSQPPLIAIIHNFKGWCKSPYVTVYIHDVNIYHDICNTKVFWFYFFYFLELYYIILLGIKFQEIKINQPECDSVLPIQDIHY